MKVGGPATGYGRYAHAITRSVDGRYEVADPAASAMMAGAFTRANASHLQSAIGR